MKSFKKIIFMFAVVIGLGLNTYAQVGSDDQKRPPKKPPVVDPGTKPPRDNRPPPRGDDRPKKPGSSYNFV